MPPNPFDQLGIKKQLVESLRAQGKLDEFLRFYVRGVQTFVHPDVGGDRDLSAEINAAYTELRRHPDNVPSWITSMKNGSSLELEAIVGGLVSEVERLRKIEQEHEELQSKYAQLLTGGATGATRRTAPSSTERRTADPVTPPRRPATTATPRTPPPPPRERTAPISDYAGYILMPRASTYALGAEALRAELEATRLFIHPLFVRPDGSGIFRPEVTKALGIDVPVLAWGLGIDRMALMHLGLNDLRELFTPDIESVRMRRGN